MTQTKQEWDAQWDAEHMEPVHLTGRIIGLDTTHRHHRTSFILFHDDEGTSHRFEWMNSEVDALFANCVYGQRGTLTINNWYYQVPVAFSKE